MESSSSAIKSSDLESFSKHLRYSDRILALCGAGLSAASGLPTFRGVGGLWRSHDAVSLATPEAFEENPGLVWQFYSYRRHMALQAQPNAGHYALSELAARKKGFLTLSQNVDGLSQRAQHLPSQLRLLHGSLFDVKCSAFYCNYKESNNFTDPIIPALAIPKGVSNPAPVGTAQDSAQATESLSNAMNAGKELDISDDRIDIPDLDPKDLPHCPKCGDGLLRPGVVWFNEMLPTQVLRDIQEWFLKSDKIDLILVIGTSAKVYPAASYVDKARERGARVAVINMDRADEPAGGLEKGDWFFQGDASVILPEILKGEIGTMSSKEEMSLSEMS
ncbi:hypothetical protein P7C71_g2326, partial [Lecanoromycetidae sp. Uapishka_2]